MKVFSNFAQYSPEYWQVRRGVPTASEFSSIITAKKQELAAGHRSYINKLVGDRLDAEYPRVNEHANAAMRRGTFMEPKSRRWYEYDTDTVVSEVGFVVSDCGRFGFSPDGWCPPGGVECKNPKPETHVEWLLAGSVPDEHLAQVHAPLALCAAIEWWDFVSYCPGAPALRIRVTRDGFTAKLSKCLEQFWANYIDALAKVEQKCGRLIVAAPHAVEAASLVGAA